MRATEDTTKNIRQGGFFATLRTLPQLKGMGARSRRSTTALATILSAAGLMALAAVPASATQQYSLLGTYQSCGVVDYGNGYQYEDAGTAVNVFDSSCSPLATWTGAATPAGDFQPAGNGEAGIAFDESTNPADPHAGDVYVWDAGNHVIDVFEPGPAENYLCQITGAGSASTSPSECDTSAPGIPPGSFDNNITEVRISGGPLIDPGSGNFYVTRLNRLPDNNFESHTYKFSPTGKYLGEFTAGFGAPSAVDAKSGVLFAGASLFSTATGEYLETWDGSPAVNPPGTPTGTIFDEGPKVDQSSGDVYFINGGAGEVQIFGPEGHYLDTIPSALPGARPHSLPFWYMAIDQVTHHIRASGYIVSETPVLVPDTAAIAPTPHAFNATLNATVNPDGLPLTDCRFEYTTEAQFKANYFEAARTVPCAGEDPLDEIGTGTEPVTVHAEIGCPDPEVEAPEGKCLNPESLYQFRLVAANANESPNPTSYGSYSEPQQLETLPIPTIDSGSAATPTPTTADLSFEVNPKGHDTACVVEWGETADPDNPAVPYQHTEPCQPADLGASFADVTATLHLEGLTEGASYHWRVVVSSVAATVHGPDHTFVYLRPQAEEVQQSCENEALRTENASLSLPDCRAYELLTPATKNGAAIAHGLFIPASIAAASGERVIGTSLTAFAGAGSATGNRYLAEGDPFSFDRTASGWLTTSLAPPAGLVSSNTPETVSPANGALLFRGPSAPGAPGDDLYLRLPDGTLRDLGGGVTGQESSGAIFSPDGSRVFWGPYEYAESFPEPLLFAVSGGPGSTELIDRCGAGANSVSADNRIVYFTAGKCKAAANAGKAIPAAELYARIDGEGPGAETVLISAPSPTGCAAACQASPPADAEFQNASADGSRVLFTSKQRLLDSATQGSANLYLYDFSRPAGERLTDLSAGDTSGQGPGVRFVFGSTYAKFAHIDVGRYVYFLASGVLAANPGAAFDRETGRAQMAEAGAPNLYVYDRETAQTTFIAALFGRQLTEETLGRPQRYDLTPDGRYLVFASPRPLTPDDSGPEAHSELGRTGIYRYDAENAELLRVSVGERGFNDNANSELARAELALGRSISADGSRVFFVSPAGLVPGALDMVQNGAGLGGPGEKVYAQNVYEWHQGEVRLISDGADIVAEGGADFKLLGTSATGRDVFFATANPLTAADTNTEFDYYDARSGGGFPKPVEPEPCPSSDACHGQGTRPAAPQTHGSAGFNGPDEGSGHPQKPPKHHKKKHHGKKKKSHRHHQRANTNRGVSR